jgi:hypothetical protein
MGSPRRRFLQASVALGLALAFVMPATVAATAAPAPPPSQRAATVPGVKDPGIGAPTRPPVTVRAAELAATGGGGGFCAPPTYIAVAATPSHESSSSKRARSPLKPDTANPSPSASTARPATPSTALPNVAYPYRISGKVSRSGGVGLLGVTVEVFMAGGASSATYTAADGTYQVSVPAGDFNLCFDASALAGGPYLNGFYKSAVRGNWTGTLSSASVVHVSTASVGGINIAIPVGHLIAGTVTGSGGVALGAIKVIAQQADYVATSWTTPAGAYRLVVPSESYVLRIDAVGSIYLSGYYASGAAGHFTLDVDASTWVVVGTSDVTGVNVQLPLGRQIKGTVTGSGAVTLGGILVTAGSASGFCVYACYAYTASDGSYTLIVPSDTYEVSFQDQTGVYLNGYYSSGGAGHFNVDPAFASNVVVGGSNVTGINVQLGTGVKIQGVVTNMAGFSLPNVAVAAFGTDGVFYCGSTMTLLDGSFSITVPAGSYQVFYGGDCAGVTGVYSNGGVYQIGWYGAPWTVAVEWVDAATVTVGIVDITGISVHLLLPWSVSMTATATTVKIGTSVTVTATANQSVGPTPYYIVIENYDGSVVAACSTSITCVVGLLRNTPGSVTFHAVIADADGGNEQFRTADLTISWIVGATYHPITPVRLLDTRTGVGLTGKLTANTPRTFPVAGRLGIPANASAVTGNVTVVGSSAGWAVYLGPAPVASPTTSTINFTTGQVAGNGLTVALSATGSLSATYISSGANTTDLVFDVTGYFTSDGTGQTYHPMNPVRELDSRSGNGLSGKFVASTPRTFTIAGRNGVPANAKAVTGNITVVGSTAGWAAYLGPAPIAAPTTSTVNFTAGQTMGNNLTVALSSTGMLSATYMGPGGATTDIVFDVTGYYTADATGAVFAPITPARVLDTRNGTGLSGTLTAATPRTLAVSGHGGVPSGAVAVTGNVTVVNESAGWAVFLGPVATPAPTTSTVNFLVGDVKGNGLNVALSGTGTLSATYVSSPGNTTDLVFDVTGYYLI